MASAPALRVQAASRAKRDWMQDRYAEGSMPSSWGRETQPTSTSCRFSRVRQVSADGQRGAARESVPGRHARASSAANRSTVASSSGEPANVLRLEGERGQTGVGDVQGERQHALGARRQRAPAHHRGEAVPHPRAIRRHVHHRAAPGHAHAQAHLGGAILGRNETRAGVERLQPALQGELVFQADLGGAREEVPSPRPTPPEAAEARGAPAWAEGRR